MPRKSKKPVPKPKRSVRSKLPGYLLAIDAAVRRGERFFSVAILNAPSTDDVRVTFRDQQSQQVDALLELCYRVLVQTRITKRSARGIVTRGKKERKIMDWARRVLRRRVEMAVASFDDEFLQLAAVFSWVINRCDHALASVHGLIDDIAQDGDEPPDDDHYEPPTEELL
jgi:hypothetical protein